MPTGSPIFLKNLGCIHLKREDLRNIAIIAHVDHGKTTLVDEMLKQSGTFRLNQVVAERVMDSNDIERERGITILAKNTSVNYKNVKINIVDTPGHADFGGEVERILKMVNGVLLLVDASEGPMPQTRFVLQHALSLNLKVIVVINKIDRPDSRLDEVVNEVLELLLDLDATDEQLDSPIVYCSARDGIASVFQDKPGENLIPLYDTILEYINPPEADMDAPTQVLISSIDYNDYVGRIGIGRIERGTLSKNQEVILCDYHNKELNKKGKITALFQFEGLNRITVDTASAGDIVCISGIEDINIGNTLCDPNFIEPMVFVNISEPTVEMTFSVNDSPFAGREGKFLTSRHLKDRLEKELLKDVALRVEPGESSESFKVMGRGELHLSILIENMRREGFEFLVGTPKVLFKTIDGKKHEPFEELIMDVPEEYVGSVIDKLSRRKGELTVMKPQGNRVRLEFIIPSRGLFGYRSEFLTDTHGTGILNTIFSKYAPYAGDIQSRTNGSLIAFETGDAVTYGLFNAQERGMLFIGAGTSVYAGMVVGFSAKTDDITVNVCKKKHITNMRASGSDETLRLTTPQRMSLEDCLEFIGEDELLEVTPKSLRIRKKVLDHSQRMKSLKTK